MLLFPLLLFIGSTSAVPRRYDRYKLIRVHPATREEVDLLKYIREVTDDQKVEFWNDIQNEGKPVDITVSPDIDATILAVLYNRGLKFDITTDDLQMLIDEQIRPLHSSKFVKRDANAVHSFDYNVYHDIDEINNWIVDISEKNQNIVTKIEVGTSHEGRVISALKVGRTGNSLKVKDKPIAWIQAGIHAREWIAPATVISITNKLVSGYGLDKEISKYIDNLDIYIIPVFNADGYAFTWTADRLWRKTRSPSKDNSNCVGTDPNRNYGYHWGESGAGVDECNATYRGSEAFSEIEIRSVAEYMKSLKGNIEVFIDMHSYSQVWLSPWGYTDDLPENFDDLNNLLKKAVSAVIAFNGTSYTFGPTAKTLYKASGNSVDWAYGRLGIRYAYTIELPDKGNLGFILPASYIKPTADETFEGIKVILNHIL